MNLLMNSRASHNHLPSELPRQEFTGIFKGENFQSDNTWIDTVSLTLLFPDMMTDPKATISAT